MQLIEMLSAALGLATLAGINLYLTVFVTGMALHFQWVALPPHLHDLSVLGNPWVIGIAGTLYFLEFLADKTPWVDSLNDAVHTVIRPLGGAMLAVLALGEADPAVQVVAALLAGGMALTAHAAKAGTRLVANASPEPFSNMGLSVGEDVLVLGGLGLIAWHPVAALVVALLALGAIWALLPGLLRSMRAKAWLAWRKLNTLPAGEARSTRALTPALAEVLRSTHAAEGPVNMAIRCLSGGGPGLPKDRFGTLVRFESGRLAFFSLRRRSRLVLRIPLEGSSVWRGSRFLCEELVIRRSDGGEYVFLFERGDLEIVDRLADDLEVPDEAEMAVAG